MLTFRSLSAPGRTSRPRAYPSPRSAPRSAPGSGPLRPARTTPASLESRWLGWAEDGTLVMGRLAEVSGIVVAGLAGFGKTMLVAHLAGQLALSPAVQLSLIHIS